jgi:hypothetical protein
VNFTNSIKKHIIKLVGILKDEDELQEILKRKFTKKEYKTFIAFEEGKNLDEVKAILREEDEEKVQKTYQTAIKKLNQEIFKRELVEL